MNRGRLKVLANTMFGLMTLSIILMFLGAGGIIYFDAMRNAALVATSGYLLAVTLISSAALSILAVASRFIADGKITSLNIPRLTW